MASRNMVHPFALQRNLVCVPGSFAPNGSSAISATSRKGPGWSVARTSAGLYTITFTDKYIDLVSFVPGLQLATATDMILMVGVYTAASKTITITAWDISDAAVADIAADANNRINFHAFFSNTGMLPVRG